MGFLMTDLPEQHSSDDAIKEIAQPIFELFYVPDPELLKPFDIAAEGLEAPFSIAALVFRTNMESAARTASIPYLMAGAAVSQRRFDSFFTAERIRMLKKGPTGPGKPRDEQQASEIAHAKMREFGKSQEGVIWFRNSIVKDLAHYAKDAEFKVAAEEMLLNTLVTAWGTLEAFISECVRLLLNFHPSVASKLLAHEATKKHFPTRTLSIESLAAHGFNVASSMGNLLFEDRHLDSLPVLKDVLNVIFPRRASLHDLLATKEIWTLWQRRHLIVHKRGLVDAIYQSKTSDQAPIGARLKVSGDYIDGSFVMVSNVAGEIVKAIKDDAHRA